MESMYYNSNGWDSCMFSVLYVKENYDARWWRDWLNNKKLSEYINNVIDNNHQESNAYDFSIVRYCK